MTSDAGVKTPGTGGKLYIVGEDHAESDPRRVSEKKFLFAMTGSSNYWEEHEFPGLLDGPADKMEVRALHSGALLLAYFQVMADEAEKLAKGWSRDQNPAQARPTLQRATPVQARKDPDEAMQRVLQMDRNQAAFAKFVSDDVTQALGYWRYLSLVWRPTADPEVNTAAQDAFDNVERAFTQFFDSLRKATEALAIGDRDARLGLVKYIAAKAGVPTADAAGARQLADALRVKRSELMGAAAASSPQAGAWKVGSLHINDILLGNAEIRSKLSIVSRTSFNDQFEAWEEQSGKLDGILASGLRTEPPKARERLTPKDRR